MNSCISDFKELDDQYTLMIYDDKTELISIGTRQQLGRIDNVCNISVGEYDIYPTSYVRNLGAWFDNKWPMSA